MNDWTDNPPMSDEEYTAWKVSSLQADLMEVLRTYAEEYPLEVHLHLCECVGMFLLHTIRKGRMLPDQIEHLFDTTFSAIRQCTMKNLERFDQGLDG